MALAALAFSASPAFADRTYDSQITGLSNPYSIAIDGSDNVWIDNNGNCGSVSEYNAYPSQTQIGTQTGGGHYGCNILSIAVGDASHDLYVADSGPVDVNVFEGAGSFVETWHTVNSCGLDWVAADNSGGPSNGTVYIARSCDYVTAFTGAHVPSVFSAAEPYISGNELTGTPGSSSSFGELKGITTDAAGNIYVVAKGGSVVDEFDSSGTFVQTFEGTGVPGGFSGSLAGLAVDPTSGNVLIADAGHDVVDEFDSGGNYLGQITGTGEAEETPFGNLTGGIAVNSSGYVYVADGSNGVVDIYTPNAILPKVKYEPVTNQTQTSGTLNASVDLNGGPEVKSCTFQYGTSTGYGSSVPCSPPTPYTTTPIPISAELSGLKTEITYHYRVVLTTANGTKKGLDQTFTPHAVAGLTTEPAADVERNNATLTGSFNGNGEDTHYYFEWGTEASYGNKTPVEDAGSAATPTPETFDLTGLTVETTYHYRIVAYNSVGTSYGSDQTFQTLAAVEKLETQPATEVTATSADLNASYTGVGEDVHYYFEWGTEASYGNKTNEIDVGKVSGSQTPSFTLTHLKPNAVYHYRIVASDGAGTTLGADVSVRTLGRYQFSTDFGSEGSGDGQLLNPRDVAVDRANGNIYVADTGNHRVVEFSSSGAFVAAWGWGVANGEAKSEVCTTSCEAGIAGVGAGQFTAPTFIEVDNSSSSSAGDVYVADTKNSSVQKFGPEGTLITSWENGGTKVYNEGIAGIAVGSNGNLIVQTGSGTGIALNSFGEIVTGQTGIAVDRETNDQYNDTGEVIEAYNAGGAPFDTFGIDDLKSAAGVAFADASSTLYVANSGDNNVAVFTPLPVPQVTTGSVTELTPTSATLTGNVDPAGAGNISECYFEYVDKSELANAVQFVSVSVTNAIQFITLNGAQGGEFELTFNSQTTSPITFNASPAVVEAALKGLSDVGEGNVSVGGQAGGPYKVEFRGKVAEGTVAQLTAEAAHLTPAGATATVETLRERGEFTLTFNKQTTGPMRLDAYAYEVENALGALSNVGGGNVGASGPQGGPYTVEFKGALADTSVPELSAEIQPVKLPSERITLTPSMANVTLETIGAGYGWGSASFAPCTPAVPISTPTNVTAALAGLTPGQIYEYRLVATRADGKGLPSYGRYMNFTSSSTLKPEISGSSASEVTPTTAEVSGVINANLSPTTYRVIFGPNTKYGGKTLASGPAAAHAVEYGASGNEIAEFARGQIGTAEGVAYSARGGGTVYVADDDADKVRVYEEQSGEAGGARFEQVSSFGTEGSTTGKFRGPRQIAVEAASGDVLVTDTGNRRIQKFEPQQNGGFELLGELSGTGSHEAFVETNQDPVGVAVDNSTDASKGDVYVALKNTELRRAVVDKFRPKPTEPKEYEYVCQITGPDGGCKDSPAKEGGSNTPFRKVGAIATDESGNLYIAAENKVYEFSESGADVAELGELSSPTTGVAVAGSDVYVTSGRDLVELVTNVASHTVEHENLIDSEGAAAVTTAQGGNVYVIDQELLGEDARGHKVISEISGLKPGTAYHFRIVATNANGSTVGPDETFNTTNVPLIGETSVSQVGETTATFGAIILPGFSSTTYRFEYGLTAAYGASTPQSASIGQDNSNHPVSVEIGGLRPESTYHFRVVATNVIGTTDGPDQTFNTAAPAHSAEHTVPVIETTTRKPCKKGQLRKHGKCVKKPHRKARKHRRKMRQP